MQFTVDAALHGQRIEKILQSQRSGITRSQWKYFVQTKNVLVDGRPALWGERIRTGCFVELLEEPVERDLWTPPPCEQPQLEVSFDHGGFLVLDKPAGLPTMPRTPVDVPTAAGFIAATWPDIIERASPKREAGIVNRLDNNTSGLILVARDPELYDKYRKYFMNHHVEKEYWALCKGRLTGRSWIEGRVISDVGPADRVGWENGDGERGKRAVSLVEPIAAVNNLTLVRVITRFGRRHQVRVQLASLGCPLVGDHVYGSRDDDPVTDFPGHFLWARRISFPLTSLRGDGEAKELTHVESRFLPEPWLELARQHSLGDHFENIAPHPGFPRGSLARTQQVD
ncbi:RluA family pseudouridine synthase [Myxococcota bacterium]|nr:RluA family pseudouridine synthase [Myxococcota bacterium]